MSDSLESSLCRLGVGNPAATLFFTKNHGALVWKLSRRYSLSFADAEEATQEIFSEMWRHAGRVDIAKNSEKMFVTTIGRQRLIERIRERAAPRVADSSAELLNMLVAPGRDYAAEMSVDASTAFNVMAELRI